ncbi:MAG: aminoglycoside phosphotransferase family protein [Candidatus Stygibacter frigidus]|nr:aminoglycoside phosphotransferase family protein [Candidatus Stygibacter frigidus]
MDKINIDQAAFARWVIDRFGENGEKWLNELPKLISQLAELWELSDIVSLSDSNYNFTAFCQKNNSQPAFLKIGCPWSGIDFEIAALSEIKSDYLLKPLAVDKLKGAILLPRLLPGKSLHYIENEEKQNIITANLMKDLKSFQKSQYNFPTVKGWFNKLSDFLSSPESLIPHSYLHNASSMFDELESAKDFDTLLHGDMHHYNILSDGDTWRIIDPKGVVGNPLYETACFMYNPSQFLTYPDLNKLIEARLAIFSEILGYHLQQIAMMAYCQSVLSACWCTEDKQNCWESALHCADLFYHSIFG